MKPKVFIPQISATYDYSLFEFFKSNRPTNHWRAIAASIEKLDFTAYSPILVTEKYNRFYILDGQGRFMACKELGLPIYYLVTNQLDESHIAMFNANQSKWSLHDYFRYYDQMGFEEYKKFRRIFDTHFSGVALNAVLHILGNQAGRNGEKVGIGKVFKSGKLKITQEKEAIAIQVASVFNTLKKVKPALVKRHSRIILFALSGLIKEGMSVSELCDKIESYGHKIEPLPDSHAYKSRFIDVYNHGRRQDRWYPGLGYAA